MPNIANPVNHAYLENLRHSPLAFYAYMVGTGENYELLTGISTRNAAVSQLCLAYRVKLIQYMNKEIQHMSGAPSDELLGAIVVLAGHSVMFTGDVRQAPLDTLQTSRFRSPLSTAQFLNVYSARPFMSTHTAALIKMVAMKGGCAKIESPGVASVVALYATLYRLLGKVSEDC
jgi:hypothetical protein